jgi:hypothetical protein
MSLSDVHRLVLTGGASNAKYVHTYWQQLIDPSRQKIIRHQPLVSIAKGAAIYAGSLTKGNQSEYKSSYSMTNVSAYNVGIRTATSDVFFKLIDRNLPLPVMGRVEIQLPPGISGKLIISLGQYIDHPEDMDLIGEVAIATEHLGGGKRVLVIVENKSDGTLGLKIRNPADDQAIPFLFERNAGDLSNFEETKAFVQRISINAI